MSQKGRKSVPLGDKYKIVQEVEKKIPYPEIMETFGLKSKANISKILQQNEKIIAAFEANMDSKRKYLKSAANPRLEKTLKAFITDCNSKGLPVQQALVQEKALELAKKMNIENFKASNGFFKKFKKRINVYLKTLHGGSTSVPEEVVKEWGEKLLEIIKDYEESDIFNLDELGLFFLLISSKTYKVKGNKCRNEKKSKERITILLGANMDGSEKLKPLVIGKSKNLRCFKGVKSFPVTYKANRKAWMSSDFFQEYMSNLNKRMVKENRKILVIIHNCPCHPDLNLSNIKVVFSSKDSYLSDKFLFSNSALNINIGKK